MKSIILLICFLSSVNAFTETNIYRFSSAYVKADNATYSDPVTAEDILSLKDSIKHPFPTFYFSDYGKHGVTNWNSFPTSSRQVGSEFQLKVSRRIDDVLYLSEWGFRYCCFLGWDKKSEKLKFAASGGNLTEGEQCLGIGSNRILSTGKDSKNTEWIVIRIDEIKTPRATRKPASDEQTKLISQWFHAIQKNDINAFKALYPESNESKSMNDKDWDLGLRYVKGTLAKELGGADLNNSEVTLLYAGSDANGRIIITHKNGKSMPVYITKSGNEWKMEM